MTIMVNGVVISQEAVHAEALHHQSAHEHLAACALAIRELLVQRARATGLARTEGSTTLALLALAGVSWRAHRENRAVALGLCSLVAVEVAVGAALVALDLPLAGAVAHSAVAALLVLAAVAALFTQRDDGAAATPEIPR